MNWDDQLTYVTPVHNGAHYIDEVIASIAAQVSRSGQPFRHIVVNDGSTDDTFARLLLAKEQHGDRLVIIDKPNGGEASAVNRGLEDVTTPYVCIVNADDPLLNGHGQIMLDAFDGSPRAVVAYPDWRMIDGAGTTISERRTKPYDIRALVGDFVCLPGPGAVIRVAALDGPIRNPDYRYVSDFELWLRLAAHGPFVRVPEVVATWRQHSAGATATGAGSRIADELLRLACDDLPTILPDDLLERHGRSARAHAAYYAALQLAAEEPSRARQLLLESLRLKPIPSIGYPTDHRHPIGILLALTGPAGAAMLQRLGRARRRLASSLPKRSR